MDVTLTYNDRNFFRYSLCTAQAAFSRHSSQADLDMALHKSFSLGVQRCVQVCVCIQNSLCLPCCSVPCLSSASSLISVDPCKPFYCFYVISCILHLHQEANLIQKCQRVKMKIMIASIFTGFKQPNCSSEELQV